MPNEKEKENEKERCPPSITNKEKKSKILENFIKNWFCFPFSFIVISADIIFLHYLSFSWSHHQEVVFDRRSEMKFQDNFKMRSMKRESEGKFICLFYFFSIILDGQIVDLQANSLFAIKIIWLKEIRRQMVSL